MKKSIIQSEKECFIEAYSTDGQRCVCNGALERHHCLHGTANRKLADQYGLTVWLCREHHTGNHGVHNDSILDNWLKQIAQKKFEEKCGSREDFMRIFGRNYIIERKKEDETTDGQM